MPTTDAELDAMRLRAMSKGTQTYPHVVPLLIEEIMRLRAVVRILAVDAATRDAGSNGRI